MNGLKVRHHSLTIKISLSDSSGSAITFSLTGDIGSPFLDVLIFGLSLKQTHRKEWHILLAGP